MYNLVSICVPSIMQREGDFCVMLERDSIFHGSKTLKGGDLGCEGAATF